MSIDQEKRRQDLRDEVMKCVKAKAESTTPFDTHDLVDLVFGMLVDMIADLQVRVGELERMLRTTGSERPSRQNGRMGEMGEEQKEAAPEATPEGTESQTKAVPAEEVKSADAPAGEPQNSEAPAESGQDAEPAQPEGGDAGKAD